MSNSSATAERIAATAASIADSASVARPRLVCSTVPVRLKTGRKLDRAAAIRFTSAVPAIVPDSFDTVLPSRKASRVASRLCRIAAIAAGRPNLATARAAASALRTSSTEGRVRKARLGAEHIAASVAEQERVSAAAPVFRLAQQKIEGERCDVVSDRIERAVGMLLKYFDVAVAGIAGLGLDGRRSAGNFLIGDAFGRTAEHAFDARIIPHRGAQRAGAKSRILCAAPANHHAANGSRAARRASTITNGGQGRGVKLGSKPDEMNLRRSGHRAVKHRGDHGCLCGRGGDP